MVPTRVFCSYFVLIGAMNPCPCGWYGDPVKECTCSHAMVSRYQPDPAGVRRISGPLLDRIETVRRISKSPASRPARKPDKKLSDERLGEPSALVSQRTGVIRQRVEAARERQRHRFEGSGGMLSNADIGPAEVREHCPVDDAGRNLLRAAMQQLHMSARACIWIRTPPRRVLGRVRGDRESEGLTQPTPSIIMDV